MSASYPDGFCHTALRLMLTLSGVLLGARVQSVWITYFHFSMHCNGSEAWQKILFNFFSTLCYQRRDWILTKLVNLHSRFSLSFCIFCTKCSANISKHTECSQNILIFVQNVHGISCYVQNVQECSPVFGCETTTFESSSPLHNQWGRQKSTSVV